NCFLIKQISNGKYYRDNILYEMKKEGGSRCVVSGREVVRLGGELISPQIETESYGVFCYFLLCGTLCYPVMVRLSNSSSPYAINALAR
ncbi:hypothetical protein, partial [Bacteroides fragilis]